jgi:ribosome maturation factor RimP
MRAGSGPFLFQAQEFQGVGVLREQLLALAEPLVQRLGYELVDVEYAATRSEATLRVYIDWPDGKMSAEAQRAGDDGTRAFDGIGVEDCERVSRELSALLDVEDPIAVPYQLEVSSPGADRILRTVAHYRRHVGQRVHVELAAARDGRRRFTGVLTRTGDEDFELNVDESVVIVRYAEVGKTRLAPDWSRKKRRGKKK